MTAIRLLLVDDDPLVRAGLSLMMGGAEDIEIVGEAADGSEVEALVDRTRPDVVLMDIRMPTVDGLTATEKLRGRKDAPQVVLLTTFHADDQVLRALRAGAAGFVLKDTPPAEILEAVRRVAAGDPVLSPTVTRQLMEHAAGSTRDARRSGARTRMVALNNRVQVALLTYDAGLLEEDGD
jgi:DNA-binding NarL/FixJ family response regulator